MTAARSQGWDNLPIGSRVSIRVVDSLLPAGLARRNAIVGLVTERQPDALHLRITSDETLRVWRTRITRMHVSRGMSRRRSAVRLALWETALFAVLPPLRGEYYGREHFQMIGLVAGASAMFGALMPAEEWKRLRP